MTHYVLHELIFGSDLQYNSQFNYLVTFEWKHGLSKNNAIRINLVLIMASVFSYEIDIKLLHNHVPVSLFENQVLGKEVTATRT